MSWEDYLALKWMDFQVGIVMAVLIIVLTICACIVLSVFKRKN